MVENTLDHEKLLNEAFKLEQDIQKFDDEFMTLYRLAPCGYVAKNIEAYSFRKIITEFGNVRDFIFRHPV